MKINWKVRAKNKYFWITAIPAALLLVQLILGLFNINWQPEALSNQLVVIVNAVFSLLTILGIVTDPTTNGVGDTELALGYTEPRKDGE